MANVVVSGSYVTTNGLPMRGWIRFTPRLLTSGVLDVTEQTATLDSSGSFSISLPETTSHWIYEVNENINGVPRSYDLIVSAHTDLPAAAPDTFDDLASQVSDLELSAGGVLSVDGLTGVVTLSSVYQPLDSDLTAIAALTTTLFGRAFLALADAAAGRTALGLGTAATQASGAFDAAGAAAAAQAASQPVDSDLTALAALTTTSYGRALLEAANLAALYVILAVDTDSTFAANSDAKLATQKAIKTALDLKATLASPALTGNPTAPTPSAADNDTSIATTAFVQGEITAKAPLASPTFTGNPLAPTPSVDDNDTSIATTAYVIGQLSASGDGTPTIDGTAARGTSVHGARADHIHPTDTSRSALASPTFTGTPAAPTAAVDTNTTQVATTAFVVGQAYAKLASPTFTGNPLAPTPSVDDNDTSIATTAYVIAQLSASGDGTPVIDGTAARGTSIHGARADHVHPTDTSRSALASPTFTGTPAAPTAAVDTNTTQLATTAYVVGQGYAKLASPTFTGNPLAPTPSANDNDTSIATTAYVQTEFTDYLSDTVTLTNKRTTARVTTIVSNATPTVNTDNCDAVTITALAAAITSMTTNLSGTPTNFQKLLFRIKDDGTIRAITWGASFVAKGVALPTTTVASKLLTVGFIYDTVAATWGCVASAQEA